jgi:hypothetical protein
MPDGCEAPGVQTWSVVFFCQYQKNDKSFVYRDKKRERAGE